MNSVPLLDLKAQYATLKQQIDDAVREVIEAQAFVLGPVVERFENELASHVGAPYAIGCASGTDALILSLAALNLGPGDEVLTSPFSFFSSASCAYKVGARPRFADIDSETFNLDPESVRGSIGPRTRAVIPVHLFGQCAPMDELLELAERHGLHVVEDAAQALGCTYRSKARSASFAAGTLGDLGCYSFFPSKNLGAFGDGGMIVTSSVDLAERLRRLRVHGGRQMYEHHDVGWNSRLATRSRRRCSGSSSPTWTGGPGLAPPMPIDTIAGSPRAAWSNRDEYACRRGSRSPRTFSTSTRYGSSGGMPCASTFRNGASGTRSTTRCRFTCRSASVSWATRPAIFRVRSRLATR